MIEIKKILIPVIAFSVVGVLTLKQDLQARNISELKEEDVQMMKEKVIVSKNKKLEAGRRWQSVNDLSKIVQSLPEDVLVEHIQTEKNAFENLTDGERLRLYIPQEQQDYIGTVEQTHQQFGGKVKVSSGTLENGEAFSSFTVTKGPEMTLVMVATGEKVYQVEIDNKTGVGTVIDDHSLDYFRKNDDGVEPPPEGIS